MDWETKVLKRMERRLNTLSLDHGHHDGGAADLDWEQMLDLAMDPDKARRYRESSLPEHADSCSMCGKMCAVRNMNRVLEGKDIQLND